MEPALGRSRAARSKSQLYEPKLVTFVRNGDTFFEGVRLNVSHRNFRSWDVLLSELSRSIGLPTAVRNIYTPDNGHRISDLSQLEHQRTYVCASTEPFKRINYKQVKAPSWQSATNFRQKSRLLPFDTVLQTHSNQTAESHIHPGSQKRKKTIQMLQKPEAKLCGNSVSYLGKPKDKRREFPVQKHPVHSSLTPLLPTAITVIRNGPPPRKRVNILLNKNGIESWEQARELLHENILAKGLNGCSLKFYRVDGEEVLSLSQLWKAGSILIAVGMESFDITTFMTAAYQTSKPFDQTTKRGSVSQQLVNHTSSTHSLSSPVSHDTPPRAVPPLNQVLPDHGLQDHQVTTERFSPSYVIHERVEESPVAITQENEKVQSDSCNEKLVLAQLPLLKRESHNHDKFQPVQLSMAVTASIGSRWKQRLGMAHSHFLDHESTLTPSLLSYNGRVNSPTTSTCTSASQRLLPAYLRPQSPQSDISFQVGESLVDMILPSRKTICIGSCMNPLDRHSSMAQTVATQTNGTEEQISTAIQGLPQVPATHLNNGDRREYDCSLDHFTMTARWTETEMIHSNHCNRGHDKYQMGDILGVGKYAIIKEVTEKCTGREFLLRVIRKSKVFGQHDLIYNELKILKVLSHENIMKVVDKWETHDDIWLVMEDVKGADLFDTILHCQRFSEGSTIKVMYQLGLALVYLHAHRIVHRDIVPENIFLTWSQPGLWNLKLGGFSLAKTVTEPLALVCGNPYYMAPEMMLEVGYGAKVDVWSSGVICYMLLSGTMPFGRMNKDGFITSIKTGSYSFPSPFWDNTSLEAKDRYSSSSILQHPWITLQKSMCDHRESELVDFLNARASERSPAIGVLTVTVLDKLKISHHSTRTT